MPGSAVPKFARSLALVIGDRRGSGPHGHPVARLHGLTPLDYAALVGPSLERDVAALLDIALRDLPPALAAKLAKRWGLPWHELPAERRARPREAA
jgi:hypothetical protein